MFSHSNWQYDIMTAVYKMSIMAYGSLQIKFVKGET